MNHQPESDTNREKVNPPGGHSTKDPVCGMDVEPESETLTIEALAPELALTKGTP